MSHWIGFIGQIYTADHGLDVLIKCALKLTFSPNLMHIV